MSAATEVADVLDADTLAEIVGTVFAGLFGEERGIVHAAPAPEDGALTAIAHVDVRGGWTGRVAVASSDALVRLAAATLFDTPFEYVTDADLADVLGELANVVGGNVKSVLPGPSVMGLPVVTVHPVLNGEPGSATAPARPGGVLDVDLSWSHEPIRVTVSAPPAPTAP